MDHQKEGTRLDSTDLLIEGIPFNALSPCTRIPVLQESWTYSGRTSSPIWVMCRGVVCLKLLADETDAMTKTGPNPIRQSCKAVRFGQAGDIVMHGTFTVATSSG